MIARLWRGRTRDADDAAAADNPGVIAPPPLIYAGGLAAGLLANRLYPLPFLPHGPRRVLGWPLIVLAGS